MVLMFCWVSLSWRKLYFLWPGPIYFLFVVNYNHGFSMVSDYDTKALSALLRPWAAQGIVFLDPINKKAKRLMNAPVGVGTDQRNIHPSIVFLGCYWDSFVSICLTWTHRTNAPGDDRRLHNLLCCLIWKVGQLGTPPTFGSFLVFTKMFTFWSLFWHLLLGIGDPPP